MSATSRASLPLEAAGAAIAHTRRDLFPVRPERWLLLGLVAFLDQCGRGGSGFPGGMGGRTDPDQVGAGAGQAQEWILAHALLAAVVVGLLLALAVLVAAAVVWVNSRATFVYLDDVATSRAGLGGPWSAHARAADSYFAWSFGITLAALAGVVVLVVAAVVGAASVAQGRLSGGTAAAVAVLVFVPLFLVGLVGLSLLSLALRDFAAPLQIRHGLSAGAALGRLRTLVAAAPAAFFVYVALKIVFTFALSVVIFAVGCATCCLGFLPIVTQTLLQPAFYFERAWSLHLLQALGEDVMPGPAVLTSPPAPPAASPPSPAPPVGPDDPPPPPDLD